MCQFREVYEDDEYEIYQNCFDLHYLAVFHWIMYDCLETLLKVNNRVVCRLINSDFSYLFKDWFNGEKKTFPLRQIVDLYEKTQIKIIQNNGCRVVVEPLPSLEK